MTHDLTTTRPRLLPLTLLLALCVPASAVAGPPFRTFDPVVVGRDKVELVGYYTQTLAADGRAGTLPGLEVHYGAFDGVEFDLAVQAAFSTPSGGSTRRGIGDTEISGKFRILDETESAPMVALDAQFDFATGNADRGLGLGSPAGLLGFAVQKNWGHLQANFGAGYAITGGAGNRDYTFVGGQVQYQFSPRWILGAEVFRTSAQTDGQSASTGFNAGGYYVLDEHSQLLFSAGKGTRNAAETNRVSTYLGYFYAF